MSSPRRLTGGSSGDRATLSQFVVFCVIGAGGYVVNLCTFLVVGALGVGHLAAAAAAFVAAVSSNFWCNRRWTFGAHGPEPALKGVRFCAVSVLAFLFATAVLELLVVVAATPPLAAQAVAVIAAAPLSFLANRAWSVARPSSSASPALLSSMLNGQRPNTWLVVPTYNERENVEPFVRQVLPALASAAGEHRVLIVDDSSPDGTGEIAQRLAAELDAVELLRRPEKDGLGRAYAAGFERALAHGAELVLQMDADFSHDPGKIPALIAAAQDADLVLGSRYVPGGGVSDWGWSRRLLSRMGSWYARTVLGVPVRDLTGGYKCFRGELLARVLSTGVSTAGFGFQVELTYRALRAGACVREVPILFRDRQAGRSKMSVTIICEALWRVLALRMGAVGRADRRSTAWAPALVGSPRSS